MSEIPKRWVGQEVTVTYGAEDSRDFGTLQEVTAEGILLVGAWSNQGDKTTYYPMSSVRRILLGRTPGGRVSSR